MKYKSIFLLSTCLGGLPVTASAHFKLDYPPATTEQDGIGNNKDLPGVNAENVSSPCGGSKLLTNAVTTLRPGSKLLIKWMEPYRRDGHYRISFAKNRADLKSPKIETVGANKIAVSAAVETGGSILMDGVHVHVGKETPEYKKWEQEVTLPDYTCDRCTLQVIHFQNNHPWPYLMYHCADITLSDGTAVDAGIRRDGGTEAPPNTSPTGISLDARAPSTDPPPVPSNGSPGQALQPSKAKPAGVDSEAPSSEATPGSSNKASGGCSMGRGLISGSFGGAVTVLAVSALGALVGWRPHRKRPLS